MIKVNRRVLGVLKPHQSNALDFACAVAARGVDYRVTAVHINEVTKILPLPPIVSELE